MQRTCLGLPTPQRRPTSQTGCLSFLDEWSDMYEHFCTILAYRTSIVEMKLVLCGLLKEPSWTFMEMRLPFVCQYSKAAGPRSVCAPVCCGTLPKMPLGVLLQIYLLGHNAVQPFGSQLTFQRNTSLLSSGWKNGSSKTQGAYSQGASADFQRTTMRYPQELWMTTAVRIPNSYILRHVDPLLGNDRVTRSSKTASAN
jgi:hypothetical protein